MLTDEQRADEWIEGSPRPVDSHHRIWFVDGSILGKRALWGVSESDSTQPQRDRIIAYRPAP